MSIAQLLQEHIRNIPDFPKPGILFKDITPILSAPEVFHKTMSALHSRYAGHKIDAVVGIESRGFIFGAPLALQLGCKFVPVRKRGKLPYDTVAYSYDLEYGTATIEIHTDALQAGEKALIIDDLLATGGTAEAACRLVEKLGGKVHECAFVVELNFLQGREKLLPVPTHSLVQFD